MKSNWFCDSIISPYLALEGVPYQGKHFYSLDLHKQVELNFHQTINTKSLNWIKVTLDGEWVKRGRATGEWSGGGGGGGGGNPTPASVLPGCSHIISHHPFPLKRGSNALKPTQPSFSYSLCLLTNGNLKHGPLQLCHRDKDFVI